MLRTQFLPCLLILIVCLSSGCRRAQNSDIPSDDVSGTYMAAEDARDEFVENRKNTSTGEPRVSSVAEWPALFGANRLSTVDAPLNPIWPEEGPELIWETSVGTGYGSPVTAHGHVIFNHREGDEEIVQCHRVTDGELVWEHRYATSAVCDFEYSDGPYSTPIIDAGAARVYAVGGQCQFMCLDFHTGKPIWTRRLHEEYEMEPDIFPVGASPLLDRDDGSPLGQLIFNLGSLDAGVIALDAESGKTRWESTDQGVSYGTPFLTSIDGKRYALVLTGDGLVCVDPGTGSVDWDFPFRRSGDLTRNATSPIVLGNRVFSRSQRPRIGVLGDPARPERQETLASAPVTQLTVQHIDPDWGLDLLIHFGWSGRCGFLSARTGDRKDCLAVQQRFEAWDGICDQRSIFPSWRKGAPRVIGNFRRGSPRPLLHVGPADERTLLLQSCGQREHAGAER